MNYLSVCDGIGAAHVAWKPLSWQCVGSSEIERFPIAVVKEQHPEIAHLGDMTKYHDWKINSPDLVCGGTPCQSFSVAGLRKGLADPRGNLALVFLGVVDHFRPKWVVWENVPGVLSSGERRDFGSFLGGLGQLGYGFAHRVLDAQYFGLAQRRKRVFVVGCLGDWRGAAAVLFERHSLQGHPAPGREKGQRPAPTISARTEGGGGLGTDFDCDGGLIPSVAGTMKACAESGGFSNSADHAAAGYMIPVHPDVAPTVTSKWAKGTGGPSGSECGNLDEVSAPILMRMREGKEGGGKGPLLSEDQSLTLATGNDQVLAYAAQVAPTLGKESMSPTKSSSGQMSDFALAFMENVRAELRVSEQTDALTRGGGKSGQGYAAALHGMQVRRLTPRECERLQGFPDDYTMIPWKGKPAHLCPDGPRYKALGNSWAVPVVRWIGQRIAEVDVIMKKEPAAA